MDREFILKISNSKTVVCVFRHKNREYEVTKNKTDSPFPTDCGQMFDGISIANAVSRALGDNSIEGQRAISYLLGFHG